MSKLDYFPIFLGFTVVASLKSSNWLITGKFTKTHYHVKRLSGMGVFRGGGAKGAAAPILLKRKKRRIKGGGKWKKKN